jgi:energy-coupling factor transporter ATP-binding protein EcfA2
MQKSDNARSFQLPPWLRFALALTWAALGFLLPPQWAALSYGVLLMAIIAAGVLRPHARFVLLLSTPILLALLLVWCIAVPKAQLPLGYSSGYVYALSTWLKLLITAGALQWLFLPLLEQPRALRRFLHGIHIRGQLLVLLLSTLAFIPEIDRRVRLIIDARRAQGVSPSGFRALLDLPTILMPLIASLLDSANKRAELWTHRGYFTRESFSQSDNNGPSTVGNLELAQPAKTSSPNPSEPSGMEVPPRSSFTSIQILEGPNFSGRTERLRQLVGLDAGNPNLQSAYVGLDAAQCFTGVAASVRGELELIAKSQSAHRRAISLLAETGFEYCLDRNPFLLSGGEQVVSAIALAIASAPKRLAIDCATEQLSAASKTRLLDWLDQEADCDIWLADNRLREWYSGNAECLPQQANAPKLSAAHFRLPSNNLTRPVSIEVRNLAHRYNDSDYVFRGLNILFEPGKRYQIAGKNGAGKSTLAKILCGIIKATEGEVWVDGKRVEPWKSPGAFVSYHFQNPYYQLFTSQVADLLPIQDIDPELAASHPLDLPFTLAKRVALLASYARSKPLLFCDEPFLGQDGETEAAVRAGFNSKDAIIASVHHGEIDSGNSKLILLGEA